MSIREAHGLSGFAAAIIAALFTLMSAVAVWAVFTTQQGEIVMARMASQIETQSKTLTEIKVIVRDTVGRREFDVYRSQREREADQFNGRLERIERGFKGGAK